MKFPATLLCALAILCLRCPAAETIRTAAELNQAASRFGTERIPFSVRATVTDHQMNSLLILDETGAARIWLGPKGTNRVFQAGEYLEFNGHTEKLASWLYKAGRLDSFTLLGTNSVPAAVDVSAAEFRSGRFDNRKVRLTGLFRDLFEDECDPVYYFLELRCDGDSIFIPMRRDRNPEADFQPFVGSRVRVTGIVSPRLPTFRMKTGAMLSARGPGDFTVLDQPKTDPFAAPDIHTLGQLRPNEIARDRRYTASGTVLAAWNETSLLLRTDQTTAIQVELASGPAPEPGELVKVHGYPEPNLFHVNLDGAHWQKLPGKPDDNGKTISPDFSQLVSQRRGRRLIHPKFHGRTVRLSGRVNAPLSGSAYARSFLLENGGLSLPVIIGNGYPDAPLPAAGSSVEVTGICMAESEPWLPYRPFPHLTGIGVVLRSPDDLRVLSTPSWWTPGRFLAAICVFAVLLIGMFIWNRTLQKLVSRRSRQLFKEKIAHYESSLRVDERTKLAVELHDSLAQNLSGAYMELETAENLGTAADREMLRHLKIAAATVKSCHGELRNCLWDLRNLALDEPDIETAIRKTIAPHLKGTEAAIRFNVPREKFTDNTAHTILRIIRELTINAIRHGKAKHLQIAGAIEGGKLLFSVRDDGCGFDPGNCRGIAEGHFGLEGIRERAGLLSGRLTITSAPGKGAKAVVTIDLRTDQSTDITANG